MYNVKLLKFNIADCLGFVSLTVHVPRFGKLLYIIFLKKIYVSYPFCLLSFFFLFFFTFKFIGWAVKYVGWLLRSSWQLLWIPYLLFCSHFYSMQSNQLNSWLECMKKERNEPFGKHPHRLKKMDVHFILFVLGEKNHSP